LFDVANPSRELMAGMTADVYFVLEKADDAVTIPVALAVKPDREGLQTIKVKLEDGKLETRKIRLGVRNADKVQVLAGLKAGEQVVLPARER
jgi:macrolide-specific efflux system membrane fusion protein